jgi:small subunit ribosomal protein S17
MAQSKEKTLTGTVISRSGDKSVRVVIDYKVKHPKYGKYVRRRSKLGVHDEHNQSAVGDMVEIAACRRLSKTKSYRLVGVLQKAGETVV